MPVASSIPPIFLAFALIVAPAGEQSAPAPEPAKASSFGRYAGWSEARFDGWVTGSQYVEMRDGVRLAVDVTRPAVDGLPVDERLPVVWTHSRYHRNPATVLRLMGSGSARPAIRSMVDVLPDLQRLVRHGYVVAAVGVRGSGASFGRSDGLFSDAESRDAYEITEWLASRSWCDGNVGMFGGSYLGITQYMAASEHPPALKAIFPNVAAFDMYDVIYPGGVFRKTMMQRWATLTRQLDVEQPAPAVDGDSDGVLLQEAVAEHLDNWDVMDEYGAGRFRDHDEASLAWARHGPSARLDTINAARVPAYHFNGWYDIFVTDAVLWFANYEGPQKLAVGPWAHGGVPDPAVTAERALVTAIEQHRWFDYWLKGIDNGIMDEPPIHYALMIEPGRWRWEEAATWPLEDVAPMRFYFDDGPSGSVDSVNDGVLHPTTFGNSGDAGDTYPIDPTTTTGPGSRWLNAVGAAPVMVYPALANNDRKSLTYTSPPLSRDLEVTGHPVVTLYLTATAGGVDLHVLLEEVDEEGAVRYVTEGVLRASHRLRHPPPWDNLGLPYQRSHGEDPAPLPADQPVEVVMDLHPTSTMFDAGHRIRVTIMGADADNTEPAPSGHENEIRVFLGGGRASSIVLPVAHHGRSQMWSWP